VKLILLSHVYHQHLLVLSQLTSTELKMCDIIMRCTWRESNSAGPYVKQARWPYCSMFRTWEVRTKLLRKMAVNDPLS